MPAQAKIDATVICWSAEDWRDLDAYFVQSGRPGISHWHGYVQMPERVINLSPWDCQELDAIAYEGRRAETGIASAAVATLAHESMHVAGLSEERDAECQGLHLTEFAAVALGADADFGAKLQTLHARYNAEYRVGTAYDTSECETA